MLACSFSRHGGEPEFSGDRTGLLDNNSVRDEQRIDIPS